MTLDNFVPILIIINNKSKFEIIIIELMIKNKVNLWLEKPQKLNLFLFIMIKYLKILIVEFCHDGTNKPKGFESLSWLWWFQFLSIWSNGIHKTSFPISILKRCYNFFVSFLKLYLTNTIFYLSKIKAIVDDIAIISREVKFMFYKEEESCAKLTLIKSPLNNTIVHLIFQNF